MSCKPTSLYTICKECKVVITWDLNHIILYGGCYLQLVRWFCVKNFVLQYSIPHTLIFC